MKQQVISISDAANVPGLPVWILPRRADVQLGRATLTGRPPARREVEVVLVTYVRLEDLAGAVRFLQPDHLDLVCDSLNCSEQDHVTVIHYAAVAPHKEA